MEYRTVQEMAARWQVSARWVQRLCRDGRVRGAQRFGRNWMIPEDTPKPQSFCCNVPEALGARPMVMPLLSTGFLPGSAWETAQAFTDEAERMVALAEWYYFRGQAVEALALTEPLMAHSEPEIRLSAALISGFASLSTGQVAQARAALATIRHMDTGGEAQLAALQNLIDTAAAVLLHLAAPQTLPQDTQAFALLPEGLRGFALYVRAHALYLAGDYGRSLGVAETALAYYEKRQPIAAVYLHLVCVMALVNRREVAAAETHLRAAWTIAQPDDLLEPFGEHHGLLGGMLEAVFKPEEPQTFHRIIDITYRFSWGWRRIHNPATGNNVADNLTTTEFSICMLAARGWSNKEIAEHLNISIYTVKEHLAAARKKLGLDRRQDLVQFMLQ